MMRKVIFLTISILLVVSACTFKNVDTQEKQYTFALGLRPLPKEFLDWWFENLDELKSENGKLVAYGYDIAETQEVKTSPVLDPSYLPTEYDMREEGLVTSPKNQNHNETCWAFATVGSLESAMLAQLGTDEISQRFPFIPDPYNPDLSEQFVAYYNADWKIIPAYNPQGEYGYLVSWQETNQDIGGHCFFSTYNLIRRGIPLEEDFGYITYDYDWIAWNPTSDSWKYHLVRPDGTVVIPSYDMFADYDTYINTIKSVLKTYGALCVSMIVYKKEFSDYWSSKPSYGEVYIHDDSYSDEKGGHAILLVGWDDDCYDPRNGYYRSIWILKNSWGTDGGDEGYFYLPMITQDEFVNKQCPDWKIEPDYMYVPVFK